MGRQRRNLVSAVDSIVTIAQHPIIPESVVNFTIQPRDASGNNLTQTGDLYFYVASSKCAKTDDQFEWIPDEDADQVFVTNPYAEAIDNGDGTYSGSFTVEKTRGDLSLLVFYGSQNGGYQEYFPNVEGTGPIGSNSGATTNFNWTRSSNVVITDGLDDNVSGKFHFIL